MSISARDNMILLLNHEIPERIPDYRDDVCAYIPSCILERAPGDGSPVQALGGTGKDWFGVDWLFEPTSGGSMVNPYVDPILDDVTKWRDIVKFPDIDAIDWKHAREKDEKMIKPDKFYVVTLLNGPFERLHSLMGMVEANCSLISDPEETADLLMAIADHKIKVIENLVKYYPVDMIEIHDDWGHQNSTFMSPSTWRSLIAPPMKKIVDCVKSKGKFIQVHSCGKIETLIPDMIEIGIDHWSSCQNCNDIKKIISKYGKQITCLGAMDSPECTDLNKTKEELEIAVKERIFDLCRGGALLPYGSRSYPVVVELVRKVIRENPDFYKDKFNCELPKE